MTTCSQVSFDGFSSIHSHFDEELFVDMVREYGGALAGLAIAEFGDVLFENPGRISSLIDAAPIHDHSPFWCPALGHCFKGIQSRNASLTAKGLGQILLNMSAGGCGGDWEMRLKEPCRFHWGAVVLPPSSRISVERTRSQVRVSTAGPSGTQSWTWAAGDDSALRRNGDGGIAAVDRGNCRIAVLNSREIEELDLPRPELPLAAHISAEQLRFFEAGLDFLHKYFRGHCGWVERVARYICLVDDPPGHIHSGSFDGYFGLIYVTSQPDPITAAEMLIHESCHQYFHILSRFGSVAGSETRVFYSPFARRNRPADRLLLAYHAFANVELFYRACMIAGLDAARCRQAASRLEPDLDALEQILTGEANITPFGRKIIDPLIYERSLHAGAN